MDRFDWVAFVGFMGIAAMAVTDAVAPPLLFTLLGGFLLSLAVWKVFEGSVWEAAGYLAWVVASATIAAGLHADTTILALFVLSLFVGVGLLIGDRYDALPEVWLLEEPDAERRGEGQ